jgi:hypothetical protein
MSAKTYFSHAIVKPLAAGLTAAVLDRVIMKNTDMNSNMYFGAAVAGGIASVSFIEPLVSPLFPTHTPIGSLSKALEGRIVEIVAGGGAAYALNSFILHNEYNPKSMMYKIGVVCLSDIIGETVCEMLICA